MTKNLGGRPTYQPSDKDRSMVKTMVGYGVPYPEIANVLKIDLKTMRKYFRDEMDTGATTANAAMVQNLWKKAMGDGPASVTATIFWLKVRAGWSEKFPTDKITHEHTGVNGAPIAVTSVDFKNLTNAELENVQRLITKASGTQT
jgi:hypothetical protein